MNPTEDGPYCEDYPFRQIDCMHYPLCLNHACEKHWYNFHCKACKDFEKEPLTQEYRDAHVNGCINLLCRILERAA